MKRSLLLSVLGLALIACGGSGRMGGTGGGGGGGGSGGEGGGGGAGGGGGGGGFTPPPMIVEDPKTCAEAEMNRSYIGCDYWPTVTANAVWSVFDFAVVVANAGSAPADVTVTGPNAVDLNVTVQPNTLEKIYLPWVPELKGGDADSEGGTPPLGESRLKTQGAYHLVSSLPVLVYQFNALQYKGEGSGKWTSCPGNSSGIGCFSFSNDASLLLPSSAMTGNYRVFTNHGVDGFPGLPPILPDIPGLRAYFTVTATQDQTTLRVKLSADVIAGPGVTAASAGGTATYTLNAGDVVQLVSKDAKAADLSGSLVQADKPVQVIGGMPCYANPSDACDHIEEVVMPAETLGKRYILTTPTGPKGTRAPATVRFIGNVDGTQLTFSPSVAGAPSTINAGQVIELDNMNTDFMVEGDHEFIVTTIQKSASVVDPGASLEAKGDPSLSSATAVEQYRLKYIFLAPHDYDVNYADIVAPTNTTITLDGSAVTVSPSPVGSTGYEVYRVKLGPGANGAHTLEATNPVGVQVSGYGSYTSYQYPAGLNLLQIAPAPPIF